MTAWLDRVPADEISRHAREVRPGRAVAAAAAFVLVGAGFVLARVCAGLWLALAWSFIAVREGWRDGRTRAWADAVRAREERRSRAGRPGPR
jgi:hypothetical protein